MEEDNDSETLKNVTQDLKKTLECPICLDIVRHPFKMCARGHLMCVGCLKQLTACPTCQGDLPLENPICIKNVLENLPHKCKYFANGCKKLIKHGNSHERFCGFRHIKCKIYSCEIYICANKLLDHCKTTHQEAFTIEGNEVGIKWDEFYPKKTRLSNNLVHLYDNLFWLILHNSDKEKQLKFILEAIPISKLEGNLFMKLRITEGDFEFTGTIKAIIPAETEQSDKEAETGQSKQEARVESDEVKENCMTVPQAMLPRLVKDEKLSAKLLFFKA